MKLLTYTGLALLAAVTVFAAALSLGFRPQFLFRYQDATHKRAACIALMDSGAVHIGMSLDELRRVFPEDIEVGGLDPTTRMRRCIIALGAVPKSVLQSADLVEREFTDWSFIVLCSTDGTVLHYYVTNARK